MVVVENHLKYYFICQKKYLTDLGSPDAQLMIYKKV